MSHWTERLRYLLDQKGWSVVELERRTGIDKVRLYKYVSGAVDQPRGDMLSRISGALGVNELWLCTGFGPKSFDIEVIGAMSGVDEWSSQGLTPLGPKVINLDIEWDNIFGIEIAEQSMAPVYQKGDIVICSRIDANSVADIDPNAYLKKDCAVMTVSGKGYLKYIIPGKTRDSVSLCSYNSNCAVINDVELAWVAPVVFIRRAAWTSF